MSESSIFIIPDDNMVILNNQETVLTAPPSGMKGSRVVEIGASIQGKVFPNEIVLRHALANEFQVTPDRCIASCDTRPMQDVEFSIKLDNTVIGSVTFNASSNIGTFAFSPITGPIGPGILRFVAPAVPSTLADVSITLTGDR